MHEYSLASAIIEQVKDIVKEHNAKKVGKITISAGPYELIVPDLLQDGKYHRFSYANGRH